MADPIRRCAVYTRKSTEEGLEQDFNSLHAQRESCEAFIRSQRGEGWRLIPDAYDDGGISGGTMERPALRRLLSDIEARKIDVVVVYKVDRLTRSLSDFSKMVEVFDRQGVSFVAVTQQFNTTSSMGRLTLNVLLSFAQFEREVTGERIRDKFAASKRKGIWMGGGLPLGYRVENRKLLPVPGEAETVRTIFREYLACSSIRGLVFHLRQRGIVSRGRRGGGKGLGGPISRGALYSILRNPIYIGLIPHKKERYPGQHEGIVDREIWDAVQEKLKTSAKCKGRPKRKTEPSPLAGKLFDEFERRLMPAHTIKNGRRYRYYETHSDDRDEDRYSGKGNTGWRLPALEIEAWVGSIVASALKDRTTISTAAIQAGWDSDAIDGLLSYPAETDLSDRLEYVERVMLYSDRITVTIGFKGTEILRIEKTVPMIMRRRGREQRIVVPGKPDPSIRQDPKLIRALRLGLRFWEQLKSDSALTGMAFAEQEGTDNAFVSKTLPLAFLAPDIVEAIITGKQPTDWTVKRLMACDPLPLSWDQQRQVLGMTGAA